MHLHAKKWYLHMFDKVDTTFSYMKKNWSPAHYYMISQKEKEVAYDQSAMHIQRFYLVGK